MPKVEIAVVGQQTPAWAEEMARLGGRTALVHPDGVEAGLNRALGRTPAPLFLAAAADDRLLPAGLTSLAEALRRGPPGIAGATGAVRRVARDGSLHPVAPATLGSPADLLQLGRTPSPVLLRTAAIRAAGGWRPGEACWDRRPLRHRALLARILERGSILGIPADLGVVARPAESKRGAPAGLQGTLANLFCHRVRVTGRGLEVTGRVAAMSPNLLTLATDRAGVTLVALEFITAVTALD